MRLQSLILTLLSLLCTLPCYCQLLQFSEEATQLPIQVLSMADWNDLPSYSDCSVLQSFEYAVLQCNTHHELRNKRFANYTVSLISEGRNPLHLEDVITAFPMGDKSNEVLLVQRHEEPAIRDVYKWGWHQQPVSGQRMLQDDPPEDELTDLEDDTPQAVVDGSDAVSCWINIEECTQDPDFPTFQPLEDENDEMVSEAAIENGQDPEAGNEQEEVQYETVVGVAPIMEVLSGSLRTGNIQYLGLRTEQRYGVIVFSAGTIVYFEYDPDEEDFKQRAGSAAGKKFSAFKEHLPNTVLSSHFDYEDGSLLFIDSEKTLYKLIPSIVPLYDEDDAREEGPVIGMMIFVDNEVPIDMPTALQFGGQGNYQYQRLACHKSTCLFSDHEYEVDQGSTQGRVVLTVRNLFYQELKPEAGSGISAFGEYIWIDTDEGVFDDGEGGIIAAISFKQQGDERHHINFYRLLNLQDGRHKLFLYKQDAIQTELYEGSASLKSGNFIWTTKSDRHSIQTTQQLRMCGVKQFYNLDRNTCEACPEEIQGTLMFQQVDCQSCAVYWNDHKEDPFSMGFIISLEICNDPQTEFLIDQQEQLAMELEKDRRYAEFELLQSADQTSNQTDNSTKSSENEGNGVQDSSSLKANQQTRANSDETLLQVFGDEVSKKPLLITLLVLQIVTLLAIVALVAYHCMSNRSKSKSKMAAIAPMSQPLPEEKPKHQRHETEMSLNHDVTGTEPSQRTPTSAMELTSTSVIDLDHTGRLDQTGLQMMTYTNDPNLPQSEDFGGEKQSEKHEEKAEELKLPEEMGPKKGRFDETLSGFYIGKQEKD